MRRFASVCVLALVAVELIQGIAARKPSMRPAVGELIIQEGDELEIECMGSDRIKFSTQNNLARVSQSEYHIEDNSGPYADSLHDFRSEHHTNFDFDVYYYTFIRSMVTKEDTGWYACAKKGIQIQNDEETIDHSDRDISWIYVYVNSSEPFAIDTFDDVTIFSTFILAVEGTSRSVVVPCRPTSPKLTVFLEINDGNLAVPENTTYDPRIGFIVRHVTPELRKGIFKCKINETHRMYTDHWPSYILDPITITGGRMVRVNSSQPATLSCDIEADHVSDLMTSWMIYKSDTEHLMNTTSTSPLTNNSVRISLDFSKVSRSDNGTYHCRVEYKNRTNQAPTDLIVFGVPEVRMDSVKVVGTDSVFLSWTVDDGNDPVKMYLLQQRKKNVNEWSDISYKIGGKNSSCLIDELEKSSTYEFRLTAFNSIGASRSVELVGVSTLDRDPEYGGRFIVRAISDTSVTIYLYTTPSTSFGHTEHVHYYEIKATHKDRNRTKRPIYVDVNVDTYVIDELETGELYSIEVAGCNKYTGRCGDRCVDRVFVMEDAKTILNITVKETGNHSIEVSWYESVPKLRDIIDTYKLRVNSENDESRYLAVRGREDCSFAGLKPGIEYQIQVSACYKFDGFWDERLTARKTITISEEEGQSGQSQQAGQVVPFVVGLVVAILLLLILSVWMIIWKRGEKAARRRFIEASLVVFRAGARSSVDPELAMAEQAELLPYDKKWEFPRKLLTFDEVLGSGAFGIVKKAEAKSICKGQKYSTVAVKMVRATHRLNHMMALQRELKILAHLGKHINIVNLLGACTNRISYGELYVIVEFCRFGNLHDYILRHRADFVDQVDVATGNIAGSSFRTDCVLAIDINGMDTRDFNDDPATNECIQSTDSNDTSVEAEDSVFDNDDVEPLQIINYEGDFTDSDSNSIGTRDLLCWAWQVSRGMKYLSSKQVVHGDLAARNILLADNNVVKICDFGLAKALYASDIYKKEGNGPLPVKWMAIESIGDRVFSIKSDVWSFGVVLWEFFALAKTPYPGVPNESVYTKLVDGFRMEKPEYATEQIYRMMLSCWDAEPSKRPPFAELEDTLDDMLEDRFKEHYLDFDVKYAQINAEALAEGNTDFLTMSPLDYASSTVETTV